VQAGALLDDVDDCSVDALEDAPCEPLPVDLPAPLELDMPCDPGLDPALDPAPQLPPPLESPEFEEALAYVPVEPPPVLELLFVPPYWLAALDAPAPLLAVPFWVAVFDAAPFGEELTLPLPPVALGLGDPTPHATTMVDPATRAAIEVTLCFMIKPLLSKIP
jgi:hypothetical protein